MNIRARNGGVEHEVSLDLTNLKDIGISVGNVTLGAARIFGGLNDNDFLLVDTHGA